MSFQPSRRQLLNKKKKLHTSISISTFFKSGNYQIWKKKILSKQTCFLLPVLRDSFGCRYGLTMRLTNCCFNEQSASQCLYDWKSVELNYFFSFTYKFLSFTEEERRRTENVLIYFDRKPACRFAFLFRKHQSLIRFRSGIIF